MARNRTSVLIGIIVGINVAVVLYNSDCTEQKVYIAYEKKLLLDNTTSCVTGRPCSYPEVVDFRIIVITFRRPESLLKLLRSLEEIELDGYTAALEIWIDRARKSGSVDKRTLEVSSAFRWKGGSTRVHVQVTKCESFCFVILSNI